MSYLEQTLGAGEQPRVRGEVHWVVLVQPLVMLPVVIILKHSMLPPYFGWIALACVLAAWLKGALYMVTTELTITNQRILAKFGLIRRSVIEVRADRLETILVEQSVLGRLLGYGSVNLVGIGGSSVPVHYIKNPLKFRPPPEHPPQTKDKVSL